MARVVRLAGLAFALFVLALAKPSRADDDSDRAEQAFSEGNRAFAAGDYHAAFDAYRAAWSLKQTFDIACNLGRTEVELSLSRDAAEHLDYCLRTFSVSARGDVRDANKRFRELFLRVRREVGALSVDVRPAGAEVTVDGASYGVAPVGHDIFLSPGQHVVRARLAGFDEEERSITAEAGAAIGVTFTLTRTAAPPPASTPAAGEHRPTAAPPPPPTAALTRSATPRTIALVAGAGASLVALGLGVGFSFDAASAKNDAARLGAAANQAGPGACAPNSGVSECGPLKSAVNREDRSRDVADVALTTGALLGAATLVAWLVIPDVTHYEMASIKAAPWVGLHGSGVAVTGAY
ncbi:MAG TPA: PEGA domain-containing protein [Polyangiaceae bacterium]|nr:PEGA domain-containing protein [Polyangiaceae bacterium]